MGDGANLIAAAGMPPAIGTIGEGESEMGDEMAAGQIPLPSGYNLAQGRLSNEEIQAQHQRYAEGAEKRVIYERECRETENNQRLRATALEAAVRINRGGDCQELLRAARDILVFLQEK